MAVDARRFYLSNRFFYGICWTTMITVNLVYMVQVAGLDPLQMVLVGTALEVSALVFEVPTGVLADRHSRKLSVVIGHALLGLSFIVLALVPEFIIILLSQILFGLGYTFISGAFAAWLADEIGVSEANATYVTGTRIGLAGGFIGIIIAVALAHVDLALPMLVGGLGVMLLALVMALVMPETGFKPARGEVGADHPFSTFLQGVQVVRGQPLIGVILCVSIVMGAFSEGFDRLFTPFLLTDFTLPRIGQTDPVVWWGILAGVSTLAGLGLSALAEKTVDTDSHRQLTWVLGGAATLIGVLVMLISQVHSFYAVIALFWVINGLRAASAPLHTAWLNRNLPSHVRATVLSMDGQADAAGQIIGGPAVGALAKYVSIRVALLISGALVAPALALYRKASRLADAGDHSGRSQQEERGSG